MPKWIEKTVWGKDSLHDVQHRFRPIFRIYLPALDVILMTIGVLGAIIGSKAIQDFTVPWFNTAWALCMGAGAAVAMFGLVFIRNRIEIFAKGFLLVGALLYAGLLIFSAIQGSYSAYISAVVLLGLALSILMRIGDLIGEIAKEDARNSATAKRAVA